MLNLNVQRRPKWEGFRSPQPAEKGLRTTECGSEADGPAPATAPKLRNIVAATDLSVGGRAAMIASGVLAERTGASLSVISVVEPPKSPDQSPAAEPGIAEWVDSQQDRVRRRVEMELEGAGLRSALVHISVGDPARLVSAFSERLRSNLVVVGAHRLSRFERILAGSTGEEILRHSSCPVMVATRDGGGPFMRILVAVDLSRDSQVVLDTAVKLAQCDDSEVQVVYAEEPSRTLWRRLTFQDSRAQQQADRRRFEGLVRESQSPGKSHAVVLHGPAGRAVLREARKWDADLIVLGVRRLKRFFPTRIGRTARHVLRHGDRSIVVVPT